jgi:2-oxoisovalerate ferredoxin oxidoreductase beta subunit
MAVKQVIKKADSFFDVFTRATGSDIHNTHYCPGCGHGVFHKLIAEALDDFGLTDRTVFVSPVGCSVFAYYYFHTGNQQSAHGRAPAVATGIKRARPNSIVISYQGDGDLAAIGLDEVLQAANRGEHITVFFVNNAIYGMTGGQMAPTTLIGQKTTTSPYGRNPHNEGNPIRMCELVSQLDMPIYVERVALTDYKHTNQARKAIRKALQLQSENKGFTFVEALSTCPTGWKKTPNDAIKWITEEMEKNFPLGVFKDISAEAVPYFRPPKVTDKAEIFKAIGLSAEKDLDSKKIAWSKPIPRPQIKVAGFGGQGVLVLGYILATAGMIEGYNVSWLPSYGPEMRGGTCNCSVHINDGRIGSPLVSEPNVLIVLNRPSLEKFENTVIPNGLILYDSTIIDIAPKRKDVKAFPIPASKIADELGNSKVANTVMIGAYLAASGALEKNIVFKAFDKVIHRADLIPLNQKAVEAGMDYVNKNLK